MGLIKNSTFSVDQQIAGTVAGIKPDYFRQYVSYQNLQVFTGEFLEAVLLYKDKFREARL